MTRLGHPVDQPVFLDPRRLLLDMAREHALPDLLCLVVDRLVASPRVALARVWLVQLSEDCTGCPLAEACRGRSTCLLLVVSNGRSVAVPGVAWTRLDGAFPPFPTGRAPGWADYGDRRAAGGPALSPAPPRLGRGP